MKYTGKLKLIALLQIATGAYIFTCWVLMLCMTTTTSLKIAYDLSGIWGGAFTIATGALGLAGIPASTNDVSTNCMRFYFAFSSVAVFLSTATALMSFLHAMTSHKWLMADHPWPEHCGTCVAVVFSSTAALVSVFTIPIHAAASLFAFRNASFCEANSSISAWNTTNNNRCSRQSGSGSASITAPLVAQPETVRRVSYTTTEEANRTC